MAKILLLCVQWAGDNAQGLFSWGPGAPCVPYAPPQEPLVPCANTALPERGLRWADYPNQSLTLLSFQATQLLNSDPSAWARRSNYRRTKLWPQSTKFKSDLVPVTRFYFGLGLGCPQPQKTTTGQMQITRKQQEIKEKEKKKSDRQTL